MNLSFLTAIGKYGLGTVLAGYLVWQLGASLPVIEKDIVSVKAETKAIQVQHTEMRSSTQKAEERREKIDETMIRLMRGTCLGLHKTLESQQRFCNL